MTMANHLDDDALNAILDGEPGPAADHAGGCGSCRARLEELAMAAAAVGAPLPAADPEQRERAIAAALAASAADGPAAPSPVTRLERRRPPRWALAAAAAAAAVAVATPLLLAGDDDGEDFAATGGAADVSRSSAELSAGAGASGAGEDPVDAGDLGDIDSSTDLRPAIEGALARKAVETDAVSGAQRVGGGDEAVHEGAPEADAPAAFDGATDRCTTVARDRHGARGVLVLHGTAAYEGEEAYVLAFRDGDRLSVRVMSAAACDVLSLQVFDA